VQAREEQEGRRIEPETFIEHYFAARDVVNAMVLLHGFIKKPDKTPADDLETAKRRMIQVRAGR